VTKRYFLSNIPWITKKTITEVKIIERQFDQELNNSKENLLEMASLIEEIIAKSIKALAERNENIAKEIIDDDNIIYLLELDFNNHCPRLLVLKQPMVIDLRLITSAMKFAAIWKELQPNGKYLTENL